MVGTQTASWAALGLLLASLGQGLGSEVHGEDQWARRRLLPQLSLGPAPYPHPTFSSYELFGDAFAMSDHIKVTDLAQHQKGAVWSKRKMDNVNEWQIDLTFRVGGHGNHLFGDGFALWVASERGVGGNAMGGPNTWNGVGVFFDTYKNSNMPGKRHPYVYGLINNRQKNFERLRSGDYEGCHAPFRKMSPTEMDNTEARVTFWKGELSVIIRPEGSTDWLQCFRTRGDWMPKEAYVGVTAMTGDLVDKHQMLEIKVYTGLDTEPYSYAVENVVSNMPEMWEEMKLSGQIAREVSDFEQKLREETEFEPVQDDYTYEEYHYEPYDYDGAPYDEYDYAGDDDDDAKSVKVNRAKQEKLKRRREEYESRKKGKKDSGAGRMGEGAPKDGMFSRAELRSISELIERTEFGTDFRRLQNEQHEKIQRMRQHIEAEMSQNVNKLTAMVRDVRRKEHEINKRMEVVMKQLHIEYVAPLEEECAENSGTWTYPFVFFLLFVLGFASYGYSKYKSFMKQHLL